MKIKTIIAICVIALTLVNCKKELGPKGDKGDTGAQGQPGPQAKTFNFSLTFNAGDTYKSYSGITGYNADDIIMTYIKYETLGTEGYWTQLPYLVGNSVNFVPEFGDQTGLLFINTEKADGTAGSPWASTATFDFKAVLISSSQKLAHPNLNWKNYNEVKQVLKLKD